MGGIDLEGYFESLQYKAPWITFVALMLYITVIIILFWSSRKIDNDFLKDMAIPGIGLLAAGLLFGGTYLLYGIMEEINVISAIMVIGSALVLGGLFIKWLFIGLTELDDSYFFDDHTFIRFLTGIIGGAVIAVLCYLIMNKICHGDLQADLKYAFSGETALMPIYYCLLAAPFIGFLTALSSNAFVFRMILLFVFTFLVSLILKWIIYGNYGVISWILVGIVILIGCLCTGGGSIIIIIIGDR